MAIKKIIVKQPTKATAFCADCKADTEHLFEQDRNGEVVATCQQPKVRDVEVSAEEVRVGKVKLPLTLEEVGDLLSKEEAEIAAFLTEKAPGWDQAKPCGHFFKIPADLDAAATEAYLAKRKQANS